jgi:hypothetical protein
MKRSNLSILSVIAMAALALAFMFGYLRVEAQTPTGSGFTYQGRMFRANNTPMQGICNLSLRLYDQNSGGAQIGVTVTITGVAMTDGYFDVTPDFGSSSFNGEARWLEIEAACPPGAGSTTFTRQAITVVPYAIYALNSSAITSTVYVTDTIYVTNTTTSYVTSTVYVTESLYYTPSYHLQGWETITGTPSTYTPTAHTQDWTTITGIPSEYTPTAHTQDWMTITGIPSEYTPTAHTQDWSTITGQPTSYTPTAGTAEGQVLVAGASPSFSAGWSNFFLLNVSGPGNTYYLPASSGQLVTQASLHDPANVSGNGISITGQTINLNIGSGSTQVAAGNHTQDWSTITSAPASYTPTLITHTWTGLQTFNAGASAASGQFIDALTDVSTGGLRAGSGSDVLWYRGASNTWRTPNSLLVDGNIILDGTAPNIFGISPADTFVYDGDTLNHYGLSFYNDSTMAPVAGMSLGVSDYRGIKFFTGGSAVAVINGSGSVGIKTTTPTSFTLQVAGNVGPNASNTYDLGSASTYWATIHYHTLTSHSLSVFSTTVTLQNGKEVSCLDALKEIKADPTKKIKGIQHMDYATIPAVALNSAPTTFDISTYTIKKNGEDGADLDMMVSLVMCADKELDNKLSDLEKRISDLEKKVK